MNEYANWFDFLCTVPRIAFLSSNPSLLLRKSMENVELPVNTLRCVRPASEVRSKLKAEGPSTKKDTAIVCPMSAQQNDLYLGLPTLRLPAENFLTARNSRQLALL